MQAQQRQRICDGYFLMPSPFRAGKMNLCCRSWFHEHQFYYQFEGAAGERYFWITGLVSAGYSLETIWFPKRGVAVTNDPNAIDWTRLARLEALLARPFSKATLSGPGTEVPRTAVVGFFHPMHMLWNELPALDHLAATALPDCTGIAVLYEPFGPMREMYPEFASRLQPWRYADAEKLNRSHGLVVGLGSRTIAVGTRERVRRVAVGHTGADALARRSRFRAAHHPIFWLSVKPFKRTMSDQAAILAELMTALLSEHPNAGFILDGASLPWDFPENSSYPRWFHDLTEQYVQGSAAIISDVLEKLGADARERVVPLNGLSMCEEVTWGEIATFYICHGGTMQNKIGWIHQVPGFIHSNSGFLSSLRSRPSPVMHGPAYHVAPAELVSDDDDSRYSPRELLRRDQNYSFTSAARLVQEVRRAVAASIALP